MLEAIRATNLLNGVVSALRKHIMQQAKRCSHFIFNKVDWVGHLNSVHLCQGWNMWISEHVVGCIGDKMATEQRALFPRLKYTGIQSNGCNHMGFVTASSLFSDAACEVALMERGNLLWYISKTKVRKWRHTSVTAPQTTYNCTVFLESCSGWHHRNINALHYWLFGGEIRVDCWIPLTKASNWGSVSISWVFLKHSEMNKVYLYMVVIWLMRHLLFNIPLFWAWFQIVQVFWPLCIWNTHTEYWKLISTQNIMYAIRELPVP